MGFLDKLLGRKKDEPAAPEAAVSTPPAGETDAPAATEDAGTEHADDHGHDHDHDHDHDHSR